MQSAPRLVRTTQSPSSSASRSIRSCRRLQERLSSSHSDLEVLGDLEASDGVADAAGDLRLAAQARSLPSDGPRDLLEPVFRGSKQFAALAPALVAEPGIEADHQPLSGEVRAGDLGDRVRNRDIRRQWAFRQLADVARLQRGDPVEARRAQLFSDAGARDHSAVARQGDPPEAEAAADLVDLPAHRRRIGRIAFEHFDRDRASLAVAQKPVRYLLLVAPAVSAVAARGHPDAAPLDIARAQVVEDQRILRQAPVREAPLDPGLALQKPVQHGEDLVPGHLAQPEQGPEARGGRALREEPRRGELRKRIGDPRGDGGERDAAVAAVAAVLAGEDPLEAQALQRSEDRGGVAVRERAADLDGPGASRASGSGVDHGADSLGEPAGVAGEVGDGLLADALSLAPVAPEQDRRLSAAVRDFVDSV